MGWDGQAVPYSYIVDERRKGVAVALRTAIGWQWPLTTFKRAMGGSGHDRQAKRRQSGDESELRRVRLGGDRRGMCYCSGRQEPAQDKADERQATAPLALPSPSNTAKRAARQAASGCCWAGGVGAALTVHEERPAVPALL